MELYQRYGRALLRKAERVLGNPEDAQDVVQELFTDLFENASMDVTLPYLYRSVTNRCLNKIRDHKTRSRLVDVYVAPTTPTARRSCEGRVIDVDVLAKLVDGLDTMNQEILVYYYVDDMSQEEIAEILSSSRKTVGIRLGKIRDALKKLEEGVS